MVHIMSQKKNIHVYFVTQRLTFSKHAIVTEVKANCYDCAAIIPCQLHPGQKDSTQHCLENVLELWI